MIVNRNRMIYLSVLTLFGMGALGILLIYFVQLRDVLPVFYAGKKPFLQIVMGLFYGSFSALLAVLLIRSKPFVNIRAFFAEVLAGIEPSFFEIILYSACAGIGEEILFRAGIQPLIGIWPAAILFVFLHGYISPRNINLSLYGVFLIIISAGLGFLFKFFGLAASVLAHFIYDVTMFCILRYTVKPKNV